MAHAVFLSGSAERELADIDGTDRRQRLADAMATLANEPRPPGVKILRGRARGRPVLLRMRVGDYRIVYEIDDKKRTVTVLAIGHRREIYRR